MEITNYSWKNNDFPNEIHENEVHIWRVHVDINQEPEIALLNSICNDEKIQADKYRFMKDRVIYITARATLRKLLGIYINEDPGALIFSKNSYGKPYLLSQNIKPDIFFNLAHSKDGILLAFMRGCELGIDLEFHRDDFTLLDIAKKFFSIGEYQILSNLPNQKQTEAFYNCWTRKEAFIKAKGLGLSIPLDKFTVSFLPGEEEVSLNFTDSEADPNEWLIRNILTWERFSAAICVCRRSLNFSFWDLFHSICVT